MILPGSFKNVTREKSGSPVYVSAPGLFIFFLLLAAGLGVSFLLNHPAPVFAAMVIVLMRAYPAGLAGLIAAAALLRRRRARS